MVEIPPKEELQKLIQDELVIVNRKHAELSTSIQRIVGLYEAIINPEKLKQNEPNFKKPKAISEDNTAKKDK